MVNKEALKWEEGAPLPFGATVKKEGVNFSIFSRGRSPINLTIFDPKSLEVIDTFCMERNVGGVFYGFLNGLTPPFGYAYQLYGENEWLIDPWAKEILSPIDWKSQADYRPLGLVRDGSTFDWTGDHKPGYAKEELIIYEMHVRGFTRHSSSGVLFPGTFEGIIERIPHLKKLGVNAVEFLPLQEFNEKEFPPPPITGSPLCQYWGYSTVNFFSPMNRYCSSPSLGKSTDEFKKMVKALHLAGIEVILDIVLNHTADGNEKGPNYSFKALAKEIYFMMDEEGEFLNFSGCGNTFNANHPLVIEFIIEVLRHWVVDMHVDGFRFDLASIFYRGHSGQVLAAPPLLEAISKDPILSGVKLIAEPWDAAGLYQVGSFYPESKRWCEWNGRYRDCIRRFLKGEHHLKGEFATRLCGSEDLYSHDGRLPRNSLNFITSHDGFTLRDLVTYQHKYNEANGEENRDGSNQNDSWNCGFEGATADPAILVLRERQMRNFHLALMISQGVPMLLMGDEYGHTKYGNNNTWCQDNALNWFDWNELGLNHQFVRFYQILIHFRRRCALVRKHRFLKDDDIIWHGKTPLEPEWGVDDGFLSFTLLNKDQKHDLYIAFNASPKASLINIPPARDKTKWHIVADTSLPSPDDAFEGMGPALNSLERPMEPFSSLLLESY